MQRFGSRKAAQRSHRAVTARLRTQLFFRRPGARRAAVPGRRPRARAQAASRANATAGSLRTSGASAEAEVERQVGPQPDGHRDPRPQGAAALRGAHRVEVNPAAERCAPAPDRQERHVQVRDEALPSRRTGPYRPRSKRCSNRGGRSQPRSRARGRGGGGCRARPASHGGAATRTRARRPLPTSTTDSKCLASRRPSPAARLREPTGRGARGTARRGGRGARERRGSPPALPSRAGLEEPPGEGVRRAVAGAGR